MGDLLVHFPLGIEPSQRRSIQGSNSGEMCAGNVILFRKLQQSGKRLVSLVEDNRVLFRRFSRVKQFDLHLGSFTPWDRLLRRDMFATDHFCPKVQISPRAQAVYSVHRDSQTSTGQG